MWWFRSSFLPLWLWHPLRLPGVNKCYKRGDNPFYTSSANAESLRLCEFLLGRVPVFTIPSRSAIEVVNDHKLLFYSSMFCPRSFGNDENSHFFKKEKMRSRRRNCHYIIKQRHFGNFFFSSSRLFLSENRAKYPQRQVRDSYTTFIHRTESRSWLAGGSTSSNRGQLIFTCN